MRHKTPRRINCAFASRRTLCSRYEECDDLRVMTYQCFLALYFSSIRWRLFRPSCLARRYLWTISTASSFVISRPCTLGAFFQTARCRVGLPCTRGAFLRRPVRVLPLLAVQSPPSRARVGSSSELILDSSRIASTSHRSKITRFPAPARIPVLPISAAPCSPIRPPSRGRSDR